MQSFVKCYNKNHPYAQRESSADNSDITSALRLQIMTNALTYNKKELIYNSVLSYFSYFVPFPLICVFKLIRIHAVFFIEFYRVFLQTRYFSTTSTQHLPNFIY